MGWKQRTSMNAPITVNTPSAISELTMRACAGFGLIAKRTAQTNVRVDRPSNKLIEQICSSSVVLVSGASGAGKSCRLRGIERSLVENASARVHKADEGVFDVGLGCDSIGMIDLLDGGLGERVATLACAGLAEPGLWAMPASCLSVGQRARLIMAMAMHRAERGDVVVADEFATPLDRANAYSLSRTMRRWAIERRVTLIAASAHEDLEAMLEPDLVIDMDADEARPARAHAEQAIRLERGTMGDYQSLSHLHYRGDKPATHTLVLRAIRAVPILGEILAGVLVISMPTLNGAWRDRAWPGFFSSGDKVSNAQRINAHLRCISRVIVEPRSRGLGIASMLVRVYLSNPQTRATEAIAAMGSVCPFFERAGMRAYELMPAPVDLRLIDALDHQGCSLTELINNPIEPGSLVERELITWSKARRLIGAGTPDHETIQRLAPIAGCRMISEPRAYAHVNTNGDEGDGDDGDGDDGS